jgi:hypothetical protein
MARHIGLVAQSKRRRGGICRARDQFDPSPIFRRGRDFCDREHGEWYVLSTSHGLVPPHQVIGADAPPLHALSAEERVQWAAQVAEQLRARIERSGQPLTFALYASQHYADLLMRAAPLADFALPLSGMSFWERLQWYDERLRIRTRVLSRSLHTPTL